MMLGTTNIKLKKGEITWETQMKELLQKHRRNWKEHTGMMSLGRIPKKSDNMNQNKEDSEDLWENDKTIRFKAPTVASTKVLRVPDDICGRIIQNTAILPQKFQSIIPYK